MTLPTEDRYVVTKSELMDELVHLLGEEPRRNWPSTKLVPVPKMI